MAIRYYDDIIITKLQRWIPEASTLRVLKPDETKKFFELTAEDRKDQAFELPMIMLSRKDDLELLSTVKSPKSYDGIRLIPQNVTEELTQHNSKSTQPGGYHLLNVLPIRPEYQLDIYTKTAEEGEEYLRTFLFKLINNPKLIIRIPYNNLELEHVAYIRILSNVANTSAVTERVFSGQFTRWTLQFELHDAFLFSIPYKQNWRFIMTDDDIEPQALNY
jgi:hypothetical protein